MTVRRCVKSLTALFMMIALAGCGGGGSAGNPPPSTTEGIRMGGAVQGTTLSLENSVATFAGTAGSTDGTGAAARLSQPTDVASDGTSLFVVDSGNSTIRKIVIATKATSTLAGSAGSTGSADGIGAQARFRFPTGIAISPDKTTLFVSDTGNNTVRKITISSGAVATLAGTAGVIGSTDGTGAAASFSSPTGIAADGTSLYLADSLNNRVRKMDLASSAVSTLAGSGVQGLADGIGSAAAFSNPYGIATDGTSIYLTDRDNGSIRRIVIATGSVSTLVEQGEGFVSPTGIATDGTTLYVADAQRNTVRKVELATLAISSLAGDAVSGTPGSTDAAGSAARFDAPGGMTLSGSSLYLADSQNGTVRQLVIATGTVSTVAGTPGSANGTGAAAGFQSPYDMTTDGTNIYVADAGTSTIRKIVIATGVVTTLAGTPDLTGNADGAGTSASFNFPSGITTDGTDLFVADTDNNTIRRIAIASGVVSTVAGSAGSTGSDDGTGSAARFNSPGSITTDGTNLYVSDTGSNTIRKIVIASGVVSTLAGASAGLNSPYGLTTNGTTLYVADAGNGAVREISISTGVVSTLAITGATLDYPTGLTCDGKTIYLADSGNGTVYKIVIATGAATTVSTAFSDPNGITTDGKNLYVADAHDNVIVKIK